MSGKKWTNDEVMLLKENYRLPFDKVLQVLPHRSPLSIACKAFTLGLQKDYVASNNLGVLLEDAPESYYWVGFLLADGCIHKKDLSVTSTVKDIDHLQKFSDYIGSTLPVRRFTPTTSFSNTERCEVKVRHKFDVRKIQEKFDWQYNKTYTPPKHIPANDEYAISMFLGFIDGDGSILNRRTSKAKIISFQNHASWYDWFLMIHAVLESSVGYSVPKPKLDKEGYCSWSISNTKTHHFLKQFAISNNLPILARKWDRIDLSYVSHKNKNKDICREFVILAGQGYTVKQISQLLGASCSSVWFYLRTRKDETN